VQGLPDGKGSTSFDVSRLTLLDLMTQQSAKLLHGHMPHQDQPKDRVQGEKRKKPIVVFSGESSGASAQSDDLTSRDPTHADTPIPLGDLDSRPHLWHASPPAVPIYKDGLPTRPSARSLS